MIRVKAFHRFQIDVAHHSRVRHGHRSCAALVEMLVHRRPESELLEALFTLIVHFAGVKRPMLA